MSEYYVRSHTFCCSVRLGVFITSILGIGLGGLLTVAGIIQLKNLGHAPLSEKWPYIIQIVVYGLYAVVSITAFIGATCRKLQLIRSYAVVLAVHLIFSIASGGYSLFHYFKDSPNVVAECINGSTDATKIQVCKQGEDVVKGVMVGVFIFVWFMELCKLFYFVYQGGTLIRFFVGGIFIVREYGYQLEEEVALRAKGGPW
ncbi:hypothetical protein BDP27DRAFT_545945 [Rhodocollybia butyracea]|uniref:Tetraspanin n=1 Tax=Rhodocollybia butyracea TaxID=206335 RepID=A0A9P5PXG4_9AGAR|nr:hypothetical protein BDP27DRAFT_545945 [Rhodocollybia butyracea]